MDKKKLFRRCIGILLCLCILGISGILAINAGVKLTTEDQVLLSEEAAKLENIDCILVLGCGVRADGSPSAMLEDRLKRSVELYELGVSSKLLMSGDHRSDDYNEVQTMKNYAIFNNIKSIISNVMSIIKNVISVAWSAIKVIWDNGLSQIVQFALNRLATMSVIRLDEDAVLKTVEA